MDDFSEKSAEPALDAAVSLEQIRHVLTTGTTGAVAAVMGAALYAGAVAPFQPGLLLWGWVGVAAAVGALRLGLALWMRDPVRRPTSPGRWPLFCILIGGLSGAVWGFAAFFLLPDAPTDVMFLVACLLTGMPTGAMASLGNYFPGYAAYIVTSVLPFALVQALQQDLHPVLTGLACFFFACFLLRMSFITSQSLRAAIADRLKLEKVTRSLLAARDSADSANRAKSSFLANMSHEIRTPLNAVVGISELMQDVGDNPRTVSYAATIRKSALSLLGIINDVLDLSRIEAGGMSLRKERCEIGTLVRDLMDMFQPVAEGKQLTLQLELAADLPPALRADTVRVRQILVNLLGNAIKFTTTGGVWMGVSRDQAPDGTPQLVLLVKDTGIGIRRDALQELFKPFVRVHDRDLPGQTGTGLGLSITAELVRLMGGTITVESMLGRGSSFQVRLPLEEDLTPAVATRRAVAQDSGRVRGRRRVLLVEDNPVNQLVATELLISLGCEVITADSGADGLRAMNDGGFDLVLMDCQMPVMDGFEATRRWRAHEQQMGVHRLPVVALTANAITGDRELCIAAGMDDYLTKPVSREQLEDVLQAFLGAPADAGA